MHHIQKFRVAQWRTLIVVFCSLAGHLIAAPMDILEARLASFSTWSGTFDQTVTDESGHPVQEVSGILQINKPMQFFWQTQEPFPQLVISNGNTLWVYDQDLEQVIIRDMSAEIAPLPAAILSGESDLLKDLFKVSDYFEQALEDEALREQVFQLTPKDGQGSGEFDLLTIEFKAGQLKKLQLLDALGQTTTLVMVSQVTDPKLKRSQFEFQLPEGVDIIDERESLTNE